MSAAALRTAAALMRERAEAATPGPWTLYHDGISGPGVADEVTGPDCGCGGAILNEDTEMHIASWHPAVAIAVADWLDREAEIWDAVLVRATQYAPKVEITIGLSTHEQALAVATTYLGRTAP